MKKRIYHTQKLLSFLCCSAATLLSAQGGLHATAIRARSYEDFEVTRRSEFPAAPRAGVSTEEIEQVITSLEKTPLKKTKLFSKTIARLKGMREVSIINDKDRKMRSTWNRIKLFSKASVVAIEDLKTTTVALGKEAAPSLKEIGTGAVALGNGTLMIAQGGIQVAKGTCKIVHLLGSKVVLPIGAKTASLSVKIGKGSFNLGKKAFNALREGGKDKEKK